MTPISNRAYYSDMYASTLLSARRKQSIKLLLSLRTRTARALPETYGFTHLEPLDKDYELYSHVSEAMIYGSLIRLMVRRLAT